LRTCYSLLTKVYIKSLLCHRRQLATINVNNLRLVFLSRRATRLVVIVVVIFALCWLPLQLVFILQFFASVPDDQIWYVGLKIACSCLAYMNSCVNPFLYAFLSDNFRKSFRRALDCDVRPSCCRSCCGRVPAAASGTQQTDRLLLATGAGDRSGGRGRRTTETTAHGGGWTRDGDGGTTTLGGTFLDASVAYSKVSLACSRGSMSCSRLSLCMSPTSNKDSGMGVSTTDDVRRRDVRHETIQMTYIAPSGGLANNDHPLVLNRLTVPVK